MSGDWTGQAWHRGLEQGWTLWLMGTKRLWQNAFDMGFQNGQLSGFLYGFINFHPSFLVSFFICHIRELVLVGFLSTFTSAWDCSQKKHLLGQKPSPVTCGFEPSIPLWGFECSQVGVLIFKGSSVAFWISARL